MNVQNLLKPILTVFSLLCLVLVVIFPQFSHAEELPYSIGLGFEFVSGTYGSGTRTESVYVPLTLAFYPTEHINLSLEIPYVYQSNGNVTSGVFSGTHGGKTMMLPAGSGMGSGMGSSGMGSSGIGRVTSGSSQQSQNGIGDITLKAGYVLVAEKEQVPQIRPNVLIKFPTADKERALGTGEFDEGFALEVSKWLGTWNAFAEAGYTLQGKSSQLRLRNFMTYNAGVAWQISDRFRPIVYIKGATPPADNSSSLLEVRMKLKYQATKQTGIEGYLAKGGTSSSPDYGSGFAVYYDF
jgi:hypothetical protein